MLAQIPQLTPPALHGLSSQPVLQDLQTQRLLQRQQDVKAKEDRTVLFPGQMTVLGTSVMLPSEAAPVETKEQSSRSQEFEPESLVSSQHSQYSQYSQVTNRTEQSSSEQNEESLKMHRSAARVV